MEDKKKRKIDQDKKNMYVFSIAAFFSTVLILLLLTFLGTTISDSLWNSAVKSNTEIVEEKSSVVSKVMSNNVMEMKSYLTYTNRAFTEYSNEYDAFSSITNYFDTTSCKRIVYFMNDGRVYDQNGERCDDIPDFFNDFSDETRTYISEPFYDDTSAETVIGFYCPSEIEGDKVTAIAGLYGLPEIYSQCGFSENDDLLYFIHSDGTIISSPLGIKDERAKIINVSELFEFYSIDTSESDDFLEELTSNSSAFYNTSDKTQVIFTANKIDTADSWYSLLVLPDEAISKQVHDIVKSTVVISFIIVFVLLCLLLYFGITYVRFSSLVSSSRNVDPIAKCINQVKFEIEADRLIRNNKNRNYAIIYLNIRNFSYINHMYGFQAANDMVAFQSALIKKNIQSNEVYGRLIDGRFVALMKYDDANEIIGRVTTIIDGMTSFETYAANKYRIGMDCGIYCIDRANDDKIAQMIDKAVFAEQSLDSSSVQNYYFYDNRSLDSIMRTAEIEASMESALKSGEFCIYLQPKYNVFQKRIDSAEALVRWRKPDGTVVFPDQFIPIFEKNVFIAELDKFVMEATCRLIKRMLKDNRNIVPISVNVSRATAAKEDFIDFYVETKRKYGIGDDFIEIEFTESMAMDSYDLLEQKMNILKKNGFRCSIDDFGEGFSSFKALKNLPFDELKLDKSFLKKTRTPKRDEYLISGVVAMAKALGMKVVMEGVETVDEFAMIKRIGVDVIQGYIYAKPMSTEEFVLFVQNAYGKGKSNDILDNAVSAAVEENAEADNHSVDSTKQNEGVNAPKSRKKVAAVDNLPREDKKSATVKADFEGAGQYVDELGGIVEENSETAVSNEERTKKLDYADAGQYGDELGDSEGASGSSSNAKPADANVDSDEPRKKKLDYADAGQYGDELGDGEEESESKKKNNLQNDEDIF